MERSQEAQQIKSIRVEQTTGYNRVILQTETSAREKER